MTASTARADAKAECVDAYGKAQTLRDAHRLASARDQLRICARSSCTQFIAKDCTSWLVDIESRIPSVVLVAKDATGAEVNAVTISLDGNVLSKSLDGRSIDIDPGQHTFAFATTDGRKTEKSILVIEGQKAQKVSVTLPPSVASAPPPSSSAAKASPTLLSPQPTLTSDAGPQAAPPTTLRTLALSAGAAGVVGLAVGSVFGLMAKSANTSSQNLCSHASCPSATLADANSDHDRATTDATISTVAFIAGGTLLAAGAITFLTTPSTTEKAQGRAPVRVAAGVGPASAGVWLEGTFR
jgi:hypothetical protein